MARKTDFTSHMPTGALAAAIGVGRAIMNALVSCHMNLLSSHAFDIGCAGNMRLHSLRHAHHGRSINQRVTSQPQPSGYRRRRPSMVKVAIICCTCRGNQYITVILHDNGLWFNNRPSRLTARKGFASNQPCRCRITC
jgi:hypothetical protein